MPIYRGPGGSGNSESEAYASALAQIAQQAIDARDESDQFAQNSAASAFQASLSETAAALSETNSAASEAAAQQSATDAAATLALVNAKYDEFDDRYLGAKASDPTVDNDGNALLVGARYFNTTDNSLRVYTGSTWIVPAAMTLDDVTNNGNSTANSIEVGALTILGNRALTVADEGPGNGLDADTVDGIQAASLVRGDNISTGQVQINVGDNDFIVQANTGGMTHVIWYDDSAAELYLGGDTTAIRLRGTLNFNGQSFIGDGAGSGLDADTVDGLQGSQLLRGDTSDTLNGTLTIDVGSVPNSPLIMKAGTEDYAYIRYTGTAPNHKLEFVPNIGGVDQFTKGFGFDFVTQQWQSENGFNVIGGDLNVSGQSIINVTNLNGVAVSSYLTTADEGAGNGLDADTVDGLEASQFLRSDQTDTLTGNLQISTTGSQRSIRFIDGANSIGFFSNSGANSFGAFDWGNSDFIWSYVRNGALSLFHNNVSKFETTAGGAQVNGDLTVTGGDITLSGTGRIQGIDTVSAPTDAVNKQYVDDAGSGLTGGGTDEVFLEGDQAITADYTVTSGKNAMTIGPITINNGVTVTVPTGSVWVVI